MKGIRMYMKYFIAVGAAVAGLSVWQAAHGRVEVADDEHEFHEILRHSKYVVVHFNPYQEDSDSDIQLDATKGAFVAVSHQPRYVHAGIVFVGANVPEITLHEPDLAQELADMGVEKDASTFILFRNGKPLLDDNKAVVKKVGDDLTEADIDYFIEQRWGKRIDRILESLHRQETVVLQRPAEIARTSATCQPWYHDGYYAAYPYNNWGYYSDVNILPGYYWGGYGWGGRGWGGERIRPGYRGGRWYGTAAAAGRARR